MSISIATPDLRARGDRTRLTYQITIGSRPRPLWFEFDSQYAPWVDRISGDAAVISLLAEAMRKGQGIECDAPVSGTLLNSLARYMAGVASFFPAMHSVGVRARRSEQPIGRCFDVDGRELQVAGLSNGVDSLHMVRGLLGSFARGDGRARLVAACFNVGNNGRRTTGRAVHLRRLKGVRAAASDMGLELLAVDTNVDEFHSGRYQDSYAARLTGAALVFQQAVSKYHIASSNSHEQLGPEGSSPLLDPLLSTEKMQVVHGGSALSRVEKIEAIAGWPVARKHLHVCVRGDAGTGNCSGCPKCAKTMLAISLLGLTHSFAGRFDFSRLGDAKQMLVHARNGGADPERDFTWLELVELAEELGTA